MDHIFKELEKYIGPKSIWFGKKPVLTAYRLWLDSHTNYRADPTLHGSYSTVWVYEYSLFENHNWPLLLDEAVALIESEGTFICRVADNKEGTVVTLKSYLYRNPSIEVKLLNQLLTNQGDKVCVFSIKRNPDYNTTSKDWTFAILTNGQKVGNVYNLIKKALRLAKDINIEFIIAGKMDRSSLPEEADISIFDLDWPDNLPRISQKKYEIGKLAKNQNIAIFHDRYQINDDFFEGFEKFGYDFRFLTVRQCYEDGSFFPGYPGFDIPVLKWMVPRYSKNYGKFFNGHYINGGLMIFKKFILESFTLNPLLLHNEAEDVELSFFYTNNGIIPRINVFSSATTVGVPNNYTGTFIDVDSVSPNNKMVKCKFKHFLNRLKKCLSFNV